MHRFLNVDIHNFQLLREFLVRYMVQTNNEFIKNVKYVFYVQFLSENNHIGTTNNLNVITFLYN